MESIQPDSPQQCLYIFHFREKFTKRSQLLSKLVSLFVLNICKRFNHLAVIFFPFICGEQKDVKYKVIKNLSFIKKVLTKPKEGKQALMKEGIHHDRN